MPSGASSALMRGRPSPSTSEPGVADDADDDVGEARAGGAASPREWNRPLFAAAENAAAARPAPGPSARKALLETTPPARLRGCRVGAEPAWLSRGAAHPLAPFGAGCCSSMTAEAVVLDRNSAAFPLSLPPLLSLSLSLSRARSGARSGARSLARSSILWLCAPSVWTPLYPLPTGKSRKRAEISQSERKCRKTERIAGLLTSTHTDISKAACVVTRLLPEREFCVDDVERLIRKQLYRFGCRPELFSVVRRSIPESPQTHTCARAHTHHTRGQL